MRIVEMIRGLGSPRERLLKRLAETAGESEMLAANLTRHAERCRYPTLRASLAELAAAESANADDIRQLLLQNGAWPKLATAPPHDGSSNWERLQGDLDLQIKIFRSLNSQFSEWIGIDPQIAERLRKSATDQDRRIEQLRDLTLRCDPQALD